MLEQTGPPTATPNTAPDLPGLTCDVTRKCLAANARLLAESTKELATMTANGADLTPAEYSTAGLFVGFNAALAAIAQGDPNVWAILRELMQHGAACGGSME
jgi:hypothetical protein